MQVVVVVEFIEAADGVGLCGTGRNRMLIAVAFVGFSHATCREGNIISIIFSWSAVVFFHAPKTCSVKCLFTLSQYIAKNPFFRVSKFLTYVESSFKKECT
jgi:hypothetical protein